MTESSHLDIATLTKTLRPENSPGFLLWQVTNRWQRYLRQALDPLGLTHVQFVLLAGLGFLSAKEGTVTQSRLAAFCRTDPMMTSQVVRTLENAGFLTRQTHPKDSRAKALTLTAEGVELLNKAMPTVQSADHAFFDSLGAGHTGFVHQLRALLAGADSIDQRRSVTAAQAAE